MKKTLLIFSLALLAHTYAKAQVKQNLSLGPVAGFGHSWLQDIGNKKFNSSFNGGARIVYSASPNFGVGLDATFRTEGIYTKLESPLFIQDINFNFINVDPKLYYFFGKRGERFRPKIGIGPNFGFLVGGKSKSTSGTMNTEFKSTDLFKSFNFGLSGVVGFNYRIKNATWLNIDAVYNNGFTDMNGNNPGSLKTRSIFLNVGLTFGIGNYKKK